MKNREYNKQFALNNGYFWLPCPLCGQEFGGHEWEKESNGKKTAIKTDEPAIGKGICPDCVEADKGNWPGYKYE